MNPRNKPTIQAPLSSLSAEQYQTPYTAFTHEFQELCSLAMDRAIGMEKASFDAVLQMQSRVIDACDVSNYDVSKYEAVSCCTPALGNLFECMAQAITSFMELQLACLSSLMPYIVPKTATGLQLVAQAPKAAASSVPTLAQPPAHALEHGMDIAIGAHAA